MSLVRKRIDGWRYAIKRTRLPMKSNADRRQKLKEVYALAASGDCRYIIRYYDAWFQEDHLYIQTEYCEGVRRCLLALLFVVVVLLTLFCVPCLCRDRCPT